MCLIPRGTDQKSEHWAAKGFCRWSAFLLIDWRLRFFWFGRETRCDVTLCCCTFGVASPSKQRILESEELLARFLLATFANLH